MHVLADDAVRFRRGEGDVARDLAVGVGDAAGAEAEGCGIGIAGLRLGRVSAVPENDRPFGSEPEGIVQGWCLRSGILYLGEADIGHDADNKIVPFGLAADFARS